MATNLSWYKTPELQILKMLAWVIWDNEHVSADALWVRTEKLCPQIFEIVTGQPTTFESICEQTLKEQGLEITPNKLYNRAHKTEYNFEYNAYLDKVEAAYRVVTKKVTV